MFTNYVNVDIYRISSVGANILTFGFQETFIVLVVAEALEGALLGGDWRGLVLHYLMVIMVIVVMVVVVISVSGCGEVRPGH